MNILVFNCGSSSLKYKLLSMPERVELAGGEAQRVGPRTAKPACIFHRMNGGEEEYHVDMPDHAVAFEEVMRLLSKHPELKVDAVGHRMVHGSTIFHDHTVVDSKVLADLEGTKELAPLHNPPAITLVAACLERYPAMPAVLVFDTAYHSTIPEYARTYALPKQIRDDIGIRKYGFHGTSHRYVANEAAKFLGKPIEKLNAVSCHLGSGGASLCCIVDGKSIDNTMGFSPLQGLMMSTRCGDLDAAVVVKLLAECSGKTEQVEALLNKKSGVLGMSGSTADIRDVVSYRNGDESAREETDRMDVTLETYLWRIKKYLGSYLSIVASAAGEPADTIVFTDTIGELVGEVRSVVCSNMGVFGLSIDEDRNMKVDGLPVDIASDDSRVRVLVIQTNEELAIARATYSTITAKRNS